MSSKVVSRPLGPLSKMATASTDPLSSSFIDYHFRSYPALARRDIHSTTCYLPVPAAQLLQHNPQLISQATRAFYLRDPIDLKSCQHMKHFSPDNRVFCKVGGYNQVMSLIRYVNNVPGTLLRLMKFPHCVYFLYHCEKISKVFF